MRNVSKMKTYVKHDALNYEINIKGFCPCIDNVLRSAYAIQIK